MPLLAATATTHPVLVWLVVALALLLAAAWYVGHCAWFPFAACRRCDGAGKFRSSSGRAWRDCRRCKGTGRRVRLGRRAWERVRSIRNSAQ